jgi:Fic family protein
VAIWQAPLLVPHCWFSHQLNDWYNSLSEISFENIVEYHYRFEKIHPFQDGNGRVGRLLMFRECLRNIVPFIIY